MNPSDLPDHKPYSDCFLVCFKITCKILISIRTFSVSYSVLFDDVGIVRKPVELLHKQIIVHFSFFLVFDTGKVRTP